MIENCLPSETAPLLSRIKTWQLLGLGFGGCCLLYDVTCGASSGKIGLIQGGCFAAAMILASFDARRYRSGAPLPEHPLQWVSDSDISIELLNQTIAQTMEQREFRVEPCHPFETELGFGVHTVNAGRTIVFETGSWQEPAIDLLHVQAAEENRKKISADRVMIVCAGAPDAEAQAFAKAHAIGFLCGKELRNMLITEEPAEETAGTPDRPKTAFFMALLRRFLGLRQR